MPDIPLLAENGEGGWVQLIVVVLIGLVAAIQAIFRWIRQSREERKRAEERGETAPPSIGDQVSREVRKYLGEISSAPPVPPLAPAPPPPPPPAPRPVPMPVVLTRDPRRMRSRPPRKTDTPRPAPGVLRSRDDLRRAILAREILGPPVGLRGRRRGPSKLTRR